MSARDDLARLIFITDNKGAKDPAAEWEDAVRRDVEYERKGYRFDTTRTTAYAYAIADGLLAAGWTQEPRETLGHLVLASEHGDWTYRMGMADVMSLEDARQYREELLGRDERTPYAVVALLRVDPDEVPGVAEGEPYPDVVAHEPVEGYWSGCSKPSCQCHTPGRVCAEFLPDAHDAYCVRCGWFEPSHESWQYRQRGWTSPPPFPKPDGPEPPIPRYWVCDEDAYVEYMTDDKADAQRFIDDLPPGGRTLTITDSQAAR